jgi:hypothetical protein
MTMNFVFVSKVKLRREKSSPPVLGAIYRLTTMGVCMVVQRSLSFCYSVLMLRAVLIGISEGKEFDDGNLIFRLKKYCGEELPLLVFSLYS